MSDKPIIFSADMIRALNEGRKTQTRRIIKARGWLPEFCGVPYDDKNDPSNYGWWDDHWCEWVTLDQFRNYTFVPYATGDRLWVKEAWRTSPAYDDLKPSDMGGDESIFYEADGTWESWGWGNIGCISGGRYRHARFMPRWASRTTLVVTDVRAQRVQEISAEDTKAEGVPFDASALAPYEWSVSRFRDLWNSIYGPDAWDQNAWVAAISFDVHQRNIDQMEGAG